MPIVTVHMLEGRTDEQKRALVEDTTQAICSTLSVKREQVRIIIEEMKRDNYAIGGELVSDRKV
ncbi:MAG: 2-hydroxymuconate tautomerase family protein [Synergistales bacterium]|nr:2-hydroxymuconate tautomerase family protein [Synergistales bacterium]